MTMRPLLAGLAGLVLALAGACDASKPELEKARKDLATVTAERDDLKGKLAQATSEVETLKKENEELKAKAAPAAAAAPKAGAKGQPKPATKKRRVAPRRSPAGRSRRPGTYREVLLAGLARSTRARLSTRWRPQPPAQACPSAAGSASVYPSSSIPGGTFNRNHSDIYSESEKSEQDRSIPMVMPTATRAHHSQLHVQGRCFRVGRRHPRGDECHSS